MKKIIIIGANSYIARNMLYCLNNKNDNEFEIKLYDKDDKHLDGDKRYHKINILDKESVKSIDFKCDIIYMFIGKTGSADGFEKYKLFVDVNEIGLLNVLNEYVIQKSSAKIVFPSTRLVYKGKKNESLKENDKKEFNTIYAINKYACEQYLKMYNNAYGVKYCVLRICVPYGTMIKDASSYGTAEFMLNKAKKNENITLYGDGELRRTIIHMSDLCEILYIVACTSKCINDVYNIGGENFSLLEMADLVAKKYNVEVEFCEWPSLALAIESGDTVFCFDKLNKIIKYNFKMSFLKWIREM